MVVGSSVHSSGGSRQVPALVSSAPDRSQYCPSGQVLALRHPGVHAKFSQYSPGAQFSASHASPPGLSEMSGHSAPEEVDSLLPPPLPPPSSPQPPASGASARGRASASPGGA